MSHGPVVAHGVETRRAGSTLVTRLPALVRGEPVLPPWPTVRDVAAVRPGPGADERRGRTADGAAHLVARPVVDRASLAPTDDVHVLVTPAVDPRRLLEPDPAAAVRSLLALGADDVADVVAHVGASLAADAGELAGLLAATSSLADRAHAVLADRAARLFDADAVRHAMARAFGDALDWTGVDETPVAGPGVRMAGLGPPPRRPQTRAVPTRQLHVTAGNAPVVPLASLLWGWTSRGACLVKASSRAAVVPALVARALADLGPHPLARHTSLVHWPGGDAEVEDVVLADGAFERRVVWGTTQTVRTVAGREPQTDTVVLAPRHSLSVVGGAAVADATEAASTAALGAVDSLVENQAACMSSLLHVVLGGAADADRYAEALRAELAVWDDRLPHRPGPGTAGRVVALRRGALAAGRWLVNGTLPDVRSAVVRYDGHVDLAQHPGGRLVVVAALADAAGLDARLGPDVSTVTVAPEPLRLALRDGLVAAGVDNVLPLGCADEGYPARPHDGVEVLRRLVRWVSA